MNDIETLDLEARAHSEHAHELRLWLRLLTCSQLIEKRVRAGLRERDAAADDRHQQRQEHQQDQAADQLHGKGFDEGDTAS